MAVSSNTNGVQLSGDCPAARSTHRRAGRSAGGPAGAPGAAPRGDRPEPRPSAALLALAAVGLWSYAHRSFRVVVLGGEDLRLQPGLLMVATHRASGDVPVVCGSLYFTARVWTERRWRFHVAARGEFFERGFLAGYPARLPPRLRRLLQPITFRSGLLRVGARPLRAAKRIKPAQAIEQLPADTPIAEVLPPALTERLLARARRLHIEPPSTTGELRRRRACFAELLWPTLSTEDLRGREGAKLRRRRRTQSEQDLAGLIDLVRSRQPLLMFPEGTHSPDGRIGPLRRGLGVLLDAGSPDHIAHIALAYDPLTTGRPRLLVAFGAPRARPTFDSDAEVLHQLRATMPLTCGQIVAHELLRAALHGHRSVETASLERRIRTATQVARQLDRHVDPMLDDREKTARRLRECLRALVRAHGVTLDGAGFTFEPERILGDERLWRLANEYASAHGTIMPSPPRPADRSRPQARPAAPASGDSPQATRLSPCSSPAERAAPPSSRR